MTTTEPEWTPLRRAQAEAFSIYESRRCRGCGIHQDDLDDPEHNHFTIDDHYCAVCAAQAKHDRVRADEHKKIDGRLGKEPPPDVRRAGDGHSTRLRRMTADEVKSAAKRTTPPTR